MKKLFLLFWRFSKADLRILWCALSHSDRPRWLRPAIVCLIIYALAPFNFVMPVLGIVDDMVLLPLILHFLVALLPRQIGRAANAPLTR